MHTTLISLVRMRFMYNNSNMCSDVTAYSSNIVYMLYCLSCTDAGSTRPVDGG